jgi:Zn finger protein HypA/HybF involved in hydrogenase expression
MAHTATDIQGLNFSSYFTKEDTLINSNDLNNRKKKASRACLHCQKVINKSNKNR